MSGIETVLDEIKITKQEGGNPIYVLPGGTTIYNGSKTNAGFEDRSTFFAFKKEAADKYGNVSSYKTNRTLNLVALMELTLEDPLYINAIDTMKKKLESRFSVGKEQKERNSDNKQDHQIVDYVCTQGYDGYAMSGHYTGDKYVGGYFDPEMALCHPTSYNIRLEEIFKIDETNSGEPPRIVRKPKKPRVFNNSIVTPPSTPPPKSLFGFNKTPPTTPVLSPRSPEKRRRGMFNSNNNNNNNGPSVGGKRKTKKLKSKKSKKIKKRQRKTRKSRRKN